MYVIYGKRFGKSGLICLGPDDPQTDMASTEDVLPEQNNMAGIGATGRGHCLPRLSGVIAARAPGLVRVSGSRLRSVLRR